MMIDFTTVVGAACVSLAILLVALSRYRYWLVFMGAGMLFWASLELVRVAIQSVIDMPLLYGYISAMMVFLLGFGIFIGVADRKKANATKVNCIEHTPVYEKDRHQYMG